MSETKVRRHYLDRSCCDGGGSGDAKPGTIPPWAIRYAHKDGEWLVLSDSVLCDHGHRSRGCSFPMFHRPYRITTGRAGPCRSCGVLTLCADESRLRGAYDTLAEAQAAFDALEEEWLR